MRTDFIKTGIYLFLLTGLYFSTCTWLIRVDWAREDYSYAVLIPFIVAYLIFKKRRTLLKIPAALSWAGVAVMSAGLVIYWIGELSGDFFSSYISLWIVSFGILWTHNGWARLRTLMLPALLLLSVFPLPYFINTRLTFQLKLISSQLGVYILQMLGISAYREGNVIDLGFTQLQVIDACSGLRYLIPLIVLSIILTGVMKCAIWKKAVVILSSIPFAIGVNSIRIALAGVAYPLWGLRINEGAAHDFSGWLIFMITFGMLLSEMWLLNRVFEEKTESHSPKQQSAAANHSECKVKRDSALQLEKKETVNGNRTTPLFKAPHFVAAVLLLSLSLVTVRTIDFRQNVPMPLSFDHFPMQLGAWSGTEKAMEMKFVEELDLSDYIMVDYEDAGGKTISFYTAYYESQQKGESIHSPATCLPGNGWVFEQSGIKNIASPSAATTGNMPVKRALMQNRDTQHIMYYWFPCRGRILTNAFQIKIYNFWDALTRQRTDGAVIRLTTQIYSDEAPTDADNRLTALLQQLAPVLNQFLPG